MTDCVFPEDIMLCILTRLPVKSILRFKSVCKPWRDLFSTGEFIKMHHGHFSSDPNNQSFIVHRTNKNLSNTMSIFNIESNAKKPTILDHPFAYTHVGIDVVGCCHGLVCISIPPFCSVIVLWNPVMKLSKGFSPLGSCGRDERVSLGFGYDAAGADFKVVRIVCSENRRREEGMSVNGAEMYSVDSSSWIAINVDFQFSVFRNKSDVIVNGNPYWVAMVGDDEVLVCFDVTELVFKIVSLSTPYQDYGEEAVVVLVDWNGCLGALVCPNGQESVGSLDVWVFDDGELTWRKSRTFGPIEVNVGRFLQCSKNGKVLGARPDDKLFAFDPETDCVKDLFYGARQGQYFEIYGYSESLSYIKGMREVEVRKRKRKVSGG